MYVKYFITKYDPSLFDDYGIYEGKEWKNINDIGKRINGQSLNKQEYLKTEKKYISAVEYLMQVNGIESLCVADFHILDNDNEKRYPEFYGNDLLEVKELMSEGMVVKGRQIEYVLSLLLRSDIECRLYSPDEHFIIIISDEFYMTVICRNLQKAVIEKIADKGLFTTISKWY